MLAVTGRAKDEMMKILTNYVDENPEAGMRLMANGSDRYNLTIDIELPGDHAVRTDDFKVLYIEREMANRLDGYTLAFEDKKFVIARGPLSSVNKSDVILNIKKKQKES